MHKMSNVQIHRERPSILIEDFFVYVPSYEAMLGSYLMLGLYCFFHIVSNSLFTNHFVINTIQSRPVVPKVCSADPKGYAASCQGICLYISLMATLKLTYLFKLNV
jgi:hypothetical protein